MAEDGGAGKCPFHELGWADIASWSAAVAALALGAILAALFLRGTRTKGVDKRKKKNRVAAVGGRNEELGNDDGGLDAIVVGAGVAGAALAHTLGKVPISSP